MKDDEARKRICLLCNASYRARRIDAIPAFCPSCHTESRVHELHRIRANLRRAEQIGAPATLTIKQWLVILDHFNWKCAYCLIRDFEVLEHVVSVTNGGGTTAQNCAPACLACNTQKDRSIVLSVLPEEQIERVKLELSKIAKALDVTPGELFAPDEEDETTEPAKKKKKMAA